MLSLYKIALAPALLIQGARTRRTTLRLPEAAGARSGTVGVGGARSAPPLRILFIGDSSAAGVGVDWQHEAMPQQAAERIASTLLRPVRWQLIAKSGVNTHEAMGLLQDHQPEPADILVCALGVNDVTSQRSAKRFVSDYAALLAALARTTGTRCAVISGLPPLHLLPSVAQPLRWYLGQCALRLDHALRRFCSAQADLRFVSLRWATADAMARDKFHPGKSQYRRWAQMVAAETLSLLPARTGAVSG